MKPGSKPTGFEVPLIGKSIGYFLSCMKDGSTSTKETLDLNKLTGVISLDLFHCIVDAKVSSSTVYRSIAFSLRIEVISLLVASILLHELLKGAGGVVVTGR